MPEMNLCEDINKLHVDSGSDLFEGNFQWTNHSLIQNETWDISDALRGVCQQMVNKW